MIVTGFSHSQLENRVSELQAEKDELESAVHTKHEESVKFHGLAQAALEEKNLQQEQVRAIIDEREHLREKMEQLGIRESPQHVPLIAD